jgi:hypothetical protein
VQRATHSAAPGNGSIVGRRFRDGVGGNKMEPRSWRGPILDRDRPPDRVPAAVSQSQR